MVLSQQLTILLFQLSKHSILDELENRSNHLPLYIEITLPVSLNNIDDTHYFIPKPKWHAVNSDTLSKYRLALDNMLNSCHIPKDILSCQNLSCKEHNCFIDTLHEHIESSLINAAQETVPFTQPYSPPSPAHPGWNDFVKSIQSEALDWHSIWISSGRPESGFVYDMRRSSRKTYHRQVDFLVFTYFIVLKRESKIKGVKIAESFFKV